MKLFTRHLSLDQAIARLWPKTASVTFAATTVRERRAVSAIVPILLRGARPDDPRMPDLCARARNADLELELWQVDNQRHFAIVEPDAVRRGAGAYLFTILPREPAETDPTLAGPVVLQAPHAYFDRDTGSIAGRIFFESTTVDRPRGFFTNTIHRYQDRPGTRVARPDSQADVCHNPDHLFSTATRAVATAGRYRFVQIHGFAPGRDGPDGATLAVVSAGRASGSSPVSVATADRLVALFGPGVKRFPEQTGFLGATGNVQGRLLDGHPGCAFVHVELASDIRRRLLAEAGLRQRFEAAITMPHRY